MMPTSSLGALAEKGGCFASRNGEEEKKPTSLQGYDLRLQAGENCLPSGYGRHEVPTSHPQDKGRAGDSHIHSSGRPEETKQR